MRTTVITLAATVVGLVFPGAATASRCIGTTRYGDRITAANGFQAHGVMCRDALASVADYLDSFNAEKGLKTVQERERAVTIQFTGVTPARRYRWTCQLRELTLREQHGRYDGWRYQCHAGSARMTFKWWAWPSRKCPATGLVEELTITRNEPCPGAGEYLEPKGLYETRTTATEERRFYRYSGFLCTSYKLTDAPTRVGWECVQETSFNPVAYWWHETAV
jgi:hypothetical protein